MLPQRTSSAPRRWRTAATLGTIVALVTVGTADYTVRPGDTLSEIAVREGTSVSVLADANDLDDPHRVVAGDTLRIPGPPESGAGSDADEGEYVVQPGDALSVIAKRHGTSILELARANGVPDPHHIRSGERLIVPAPPAESEAAPATPDRAEAGALIDRVARDHGWNPAIVKALAWQESGWNNDRVSSAGATGIMQVMPGTGRFVSERLLGRQLDLRDPEQNVVAGVVYLQYLWERTGGDLEETLAGYYQGPTSVRDNGRYPSTERYIANVIALRERFR